MGRAEQITHFFIHRARRALGGAAALLLLALSSIPTHAQNLRLVQGTPLRATPAADAVSLSALASDAEVALLQMRGGWAEVRSGARQGWVRASALALPAAEVAGASQLDTGRRQSGATAVTLGVRALPPRSTRHALIVGVGEYFPDPKRRVPPLSGVVHDMASALAMAQALQVPPEQITLLRDREATREGVRAAITTLTDKVQPGDRVFFYWSGHGSRWFDSGEGGCVEALVPYDLKDIGNREFAQWIQPIASKADKLLVVHDACHSGGVGAVSPVAATRALAAGDGWTAKFAPGPEACGQPSNMRTRSLASAQQGLGVSGQDVVHLSSSRPDEVSFDNPRLGGLATHALKRCLLGEARDLDGSGAISVNEIAACAQQRIEQALKGQTEISAHHLVLTGNRDFVPAWFARADAPTAVAAAPVAAAPAAAPVAAPVRPGAAAAAAPTTPATPAAPAVPTAPAAPVVAATPTAPAAPVATAPVAPVAPTPPVVATPPRPPAAVPAAPPPLETLLAQVHAQRDSKRRVSVTLAAEQLRIGQDALDLSITSSHAGHVYIAMLGTDGKSLTLLFPNGLDNDNRIAAGQNLLLPRASWRLKAGGPAGENRLLVLVSERARDLASLGGQRVGPFTQPLTDAAGRTRLQWLLGSSADGGADAFGSAMVSVRER